MWHLLKLTHGTHCFNIALTGRTDRARCVKHPCHIISSALLTVPARTDTHARVLTPDARDISFHLFILTRTVLGYYIVYTLDIRIFFHLSEGEIQWVGPAGWGFRIGANSAKWERSHISFTGRPTTNPLL